MCLVVSVRRVAETSLIGGHRTTMASSMMRMSPGKDKR